MTPILKLMCYRDDILCYILQIGNQSFRVDRKVFENYWGILNIGNLEIVELELDGSLLMESNNTKTIDISGDTVFLTYLKETLNIDSTVGVGMDKTKYVYVGDSQLQLPIYNYSDDETVEDKEYQADLDKYGVLLDRAYTVGGMENTLDEPSIEGVGVNSIDRYKPFYTKHRRFFSNVVFLIDHVKTTTGGVKAKKIIYTLHNDIRFKDETKSFIGEIGRDMDYNRLRVWYRMATGKDMLEGKLRLKK